MHHLLYRAGGRRRRWAAALATVVVICGLEAAPSFASGVIPTQTTLTESAQVIDASQTTTLTATVQFGLAVTPSGGVTFTDTTTGRSLGTASLNGFCILLLSPCTATLTVPGSALGPNENDITASYGGDVLSEPSSATGTVFVGDQTLCPASDGGCVTVDEYSPDHSSDVSFSEQGSGTNQSITVAFGTTPLGCDTPGTGDTIAWSSVGDPWSGKTIVYAANGDPARAAEKAHPIDTATDSGGYVCFDGSSSFTTAAGTAATQQPDGSYEGVLPACSVAPGSESTITNEPCVEASYYTLHLAGPQGNPGDGKAEYATVVAAPQGDPKMGH